MKPVISLLCLLFACQCLAQNVRIEPVNKTLGELNVVYDLSTPLNTYATMYNLKSKGQEGKLKSVCTLRNHRYLPSEDTPDRQLTEEKIKSYSAYKIIEVRHYNDSTASLITMIDDNFYAICWEVFENERWVHAGEDMGSNLEDARFQSDKMSKREIDASRRTEQLLKYPTSTAPFVDYLKKNGTSPTEYLFKKLSDYRLVICGEIHRRRISWDFMIDLLRDPRFAQKVGAIFVELPSCKQNRLDEFYAAQKMNTELILDVMRAEQIHGWWDGGEYKFLLEVWKVNQKLPKSKRIRVIAADWQMPWDKMRTKEDVETFDKVDKDRNGHMANVIESHLNTTTDKRNAIFTVGFAHAYKSQVPGGYSNPRGMESQLTAGAQLTTRLSADKVFTLFPHVPITDNISGGMGLLRNGIFDKAFSENGNKPVAFDIADSPFGKEPFDASNEMIYDLETGTYENNFDGYIFFGPLSDEGKEVHVYDIFTDEFVEEIKRRAIVMGWENQNYFGTSVMELTKEKIVNALKDYGTNE